MNTKNAMPEPKDLEQRLPQVEHDEKRPEQGKSEQAAILQRTLDSYTGPRDPHDLALKKKETQSVYGNLIGKGSPDEQAMLNQKMQEELEWQDREFRKFLQINRDLRLVELDKQLPKFQDFEMAVRGGWRSMDELKTKLVKDPELAKQYKEYRDLLSEKLLLEVLPKIEKEIPGFECYVTKDISVQEDVNFDLKQILVAVVEPDPASDPDRTFRTKLLEKLIKLGLANDVALGEKFSGRSDRHQAFLDFVFVFKDKDENYKSKRPEHAILSESERDVVVGKKMPDRLNSQNTFREISPQDFETAVVIPEHFRDDVIFNALYLEHGSFDRQLKLLTLENGATLSDEQSQMLEQLKKQGLAIDEHQFFTPEQAREIKETRLKQLESVSNLIQNYFSNQLLDEATLSELQKNNVDNVDFSKILIDQTGSEVQSKLEQSKINLDVVPIVEGLLKENVAEVFKRLLADSIFGHGNGGRVLKNELLAYPNQVESAVAVTILANNDQVLAATGAIGKLLEQKGLSFDKPIVHKKVVDFMKGAIASLKGKGEEEYWGKFGEGRLIRDKVG